MIFSTKEQVEAHARALVGKTIRSVHPNGKDLDRDHKGGFGHLLEAVHFAYQPNSRSEADFKELGVELKGAPLNRLKSKPNVYRAKERIVLGVIDYMALIHQSFYTSDLWRKNEHLLLVFYLHSANQLPADRRIIFAGLWEYGEDDVAIIYQDWTFIRDKVNAGLAHELSEGDTLYLGACTKGADRRSLRKQPFSTERAMQRAFCLKTTYVNQIVAAFQRESDSDESLFASEDRSALHTRSFEDVLLDKFTQFKGMSAADIADSKGFELNVKSKSVWSQLTGVMLGVKSIKSAVELKKANITVRTIRLKANGVPKESISFPAFHFTQLAEEEWEESELFERLDSQKYLFVVFDLGDGSPSQMKFRGAALWNMPQSHIRKARETWEATRATIRSGKVVKSVDRAGIWHNWLPKMSETEIIHVRPHGKDRADTRPLPVADKLTGVREFTKQSFWLNGEYIAGVIAKAGI